ncbi:hypothetical protein BOX15_Mlig027365g3, partial [Macrostomum lignano]
DSKRKKAPRPKSTDPSSRQLWLLAMKEGKTGTGANKGSLGQQLDPTGFTNLKLSGQKDVGYLSTSHYLRQVAGTEKVTPRPDSAAAGKASGGLTGRPNYKSAEEYYDEVIALKRELKALRAEMSSMKSKNRRLEEDYQKREKQLESLFDPTKNAELRRALADKNGESALVVQSLKQRIFKLEQQLRDKESALNKLQSDMKVTKTAEMKTQLEVLYKEIVRLRSANPADVLYSNEQPGGAGIDQEQMPKKTAQKLDALTATLRKVTDQKNALAAENAQLKKSEASLQEQLDELEGTTAIPESYRDMNRNQLLSKIRTLEQENDRLRVAPIGSEDIVKSKISLTGNVREKLELLDRRETELLSELAARTDANKRLMEERDSYKLQLQEAKRDIERLNFENAGLSKEVDQLRASGGGPGAGAAAFRAPSPSPRRNDFGKEASPPPRDANKRGAVRQDRNRMQEDAAVTKLQSVLRGHKARQDYLNRDRQQRQQRQESPTPPKPQQRRQAMDSNSDYDRDSFDSGRFRNRRTSGSRNRDDFGKEDDIPQRRPRPRSNSRSQQGSGDDAASSYSRRSGTGSATVQASTGRRSSNRQGRPFDAGSSRNRRSIDDNDDDDVLVD